MPPQTSLIDAISLDIQILSMLLRRNHHQHHRCIYHQRLSMVHQSLRKVSFESLHAWKEDISLKPIKRKQEEWTIDQLKSEDNRNKQTSTQHLHSFVFTSIPQIKSRIFHATRAIFPEIGRGHFVPMLTIALACLGRIHSALMQIGRECLTCLQQKAGQIIEEKVDHLFEVGHDELAAKMNGFVNDLKWSDVISKFRLGKDFLNMKKERDDAVDGVDEVKPGNRNAIDDGVSCNDLGEVVSAELSQLHGRNNKYEVDSLSANILTPVTSAGCSVKSAGTNDDMNIIADKPKKKRRKKKKKRNNNTNATIDDSTSYHEQSSTSVSKEKGVSAHEERLHSADSGSTPSCPNQSETSTPSNIHAVSEKKRARDFESAFGCFTEGFKQKDRNATAKSIKHKKKKAKKKRGSVIDDIFS